MHPTFAQLEAFYWVARLGSMKEAAHHLNLARPTVSLRIDDLEAELGITLFERMGRGLCLTHRGEALVPHVAAMIEDFVRMREAIEGEQPSGIVRIGVAETFAHACLPAYVRALGSRYPMVQLDVVVSTSAELEKDVLERRLDVAFAINPIGEPKLVLIPLGIQEVTWAAAAAFNLPSPLHPSHLRDVLILTNPHPAPMWRQVTDWFRQADLEPSRICRCSSATVVAQLVAGGVGVGLLPRRLIQKEISTGILFPLESELALQPSRLFAIYRFADKSALVGGIIEIARRVMEKAMLLTV